MICPTVLCRIDGFLSKRIRLYSFGHRFAPLGNDGMYVVTSEKVHLVLVADVVEFDKDFQVS